MCRSRTDRLATGGEAGTTSRPLLSIVFAHLSRTPAVAVMSAMGLPIRGGRGQLVDEKGTRCRIHVRRLHVRLSARAAGAKLCIALDLGRRGTRTSNYA
jgi:hypothetical protein